MSTHKRPAGVVLECDVADGVPALSAPRAGIEAFVLVRIFSEPIGMLVLPMGPKGLTADELAETIVRELEPALRPRLEECGLEWTGELPTHGLAPERPPRFVASREAALRDGPWITAAVCTRDRPAGLPALLASLQAQEYPRLRILVIDNAPSDDRTWQLVSAIKGAPQIDYVIEPRPGLSWARNRAIEASKTEVVAWADDDGTCDRWWAAELARGFVEVPDASAVTGSVIPAELETESQLLFERYSGVQRSRGFDRAVFSPSSRSGYSPLYPLPPFGVGGNMAFRRDEIDRIGRFDCALGPGTLSMDGDDTAAFSLLLLAGGTIVYQPSAIVYHRHRQNYETLRHLMLGYGRGLGAYYTSMLVHRPSSAIHMVRLTRRALRDQFSRRGRRLGELTTGYPPDLLRANRIGLLQGPVMYGRARLRARDLVSEQPG